MVYENVCMINSSPTKHISAISQWKHLSEFYPQDGGESQLALKLRHCHPVYTADSANKSGAETANNTVQLPVANPGS